MKKVFSIAAATILIFGCSGKVQKYTVSGTTSTENDGQIVTLSIGEEEQTATVTDGAFGFEGEVSEPCSVILKMTKADGSIAGAFAILEKGEIKVNLDESTSSGTALNDALTDWMKKSEKLSETYATLTRSAQFDENLDSKEKMAKAEEAMEQYKEGLTELNTKLFENNLDNVLGSIALTYLYSLNDSADDFLARYEQAGEVVKNNKDVQMIKASIENLSATAEGKMFTDFTIEHGNADGSSVKLSDYVGKGKWVLVDFWASWCSPCRKEIPNIASVYEKFKGDKFEVLGIAVWDKLEDTRKALTELPISWPVIFDAQTIPTDIYGINGIPQIILFAPDGTILKRDLRGEAIAETVAEVLTE